ncbi:MAG: hypothetical protein LBH43_06560, partial [Treponema sp.]|nr:hypothetical protein [Treponema sp.]
MMARLPGFPSSPGSFSGIFAEERPAPLLRSNPGAISEKRCYKINAEAKKKPAAVSSAAAVRLLTGGKHKPKGKSAAKKGA